MYSCVSTYIIYIHIKTLVRIFCLYIRIYVYIFILCPMLTCSLGGKKKHFKRHKSTSLFLLSCPFHLYIYNIHTTITSIRVRKCMSLFYNTSSFDLSLFHH